MSPPDLPPPGEAAGARPATFAEALAAIAAGSTPPAALREMRSAVATLERATGRVAADLPLAPRELVPLLERVVPIRPPHVPDEQRRPRLRGAIYGKRWDNVRATLAAIAAEVGAVVPRAGRRVPLTGNWAGLPGRLPHTALAAVLAGFARFCQAGGVGPAAVDEAALEAYRTWLSGRTYDLKVGTTINSARRAWNTGARTVEGWPGRALAAPPDPRVRALPLSAFPAGFAADLGAYLDGLSAPDPLAPPDPLDPRAGRPRSPATVAERRRFLLRAASILVERGTPAGRIDGLAALATPAAMRAVLMELHRRGGGAWTGQAVTMAMMLVHVAQRHLRLPEAGLGPLLELKRLVREDRGPGLSARNRGRLAQFDDPRLLGRLLGLPEELFAAADRLAAAGRPVRAAQAHERGLALALLLLLPVRRRNLAALDAGRHLRRDGRGRVVALRIPGAEVKNGIELEAAVPQPLARRIERHLRLHRPALQRGGGASDWLFPGPGGRHRSDARLSAMLTRTVRDALGVAFNLHLVRHLAATMLYDADPANGPVVQRLLGHTQLKTTERVYGVLRTRGAQAVWAAQVDRMRDAHRRAEARAAGATCRARR